MLRATGVHQEGIFATAPTVPGPDQYEPGEDRFWVVDTTLGFRLPNRRGSVSLGVNNLLDEEFAFQDIDPENPSIMPERMGYVRFTVAFD
jgi:outer membrane receptor protein involved in Fe transport